MHHDQIMESYHSIYIFLNNYLSNCVITSNYTSSYTLMQIPLKSSIDFIYGYWIINPTSGNLCPMCVRSSLYKCL
jgi:hypothetical protein